MTLDGGFAWLRLISKQMKADVDKGEPPTLTTMSVRSFMAKFGYERRGRWIVGHIDSYMSQLDLMTVPHIDYVPSIDSTITVALRPHAEGDQLPDNTTIEPQQALRIDPTIRISSLESATSKPVSVNPNKELIEATTIMLRHAFSQLPVLENPNSREVKGVISWESIGVRLALKVQAQKVSDFMEKERLNEKIIQSDRPLLEAINLVTEHGYVLVQGNDGTITGIVTATDLSEQFRQISEPFLLIGEIEGYLRNLIGRNFKVSEIQDAISVEQTSEPISGPHDLSFGQSWHFLENEERWSNVGLVVDRVQFITLMDRVNSVRNDVMHFRPKGLQDEDMDTLNEAANFLQRLAQVGAI